ncbi:LytTR family transcriptional regulator [Belliella sp. DSM 111904]|uniref:LytTR family transcriptional regulator n=1 Tax=Belliella filtrata TaxID=2923435 RepID=A0ABS9V5P9_9BACT|nr:LytTR family DNA-binding domain-containing protein [Belliella filtrata]MCH7411738.1 LytTR family transcriptional regulator [Belliella filtrata]
MLHFLKQPYPCENASWKSIIRLAFLIGFFVATFLLVFQPFGLHRIPDEYKLVMISGYGLVTFLCMIFFQGGFKGLFSGYFDESIWTTGKEIVQNLSILGLISIGNFLYTVWIGGVDWSFYSLMLSIGFTFAVGIFPVFFLVIYRYNKLLRKHTTSATHMESHISNSISEFSKQDIITITLQSQYAQEDLVVELSHLYYLQSADNYVEVIFLGEKGVKKQLIRNTLTEIAGQWEHVGIIQCHRSYLVNIHQVKRITGNAQGYKLFLDKGNLVVPVSRKFAGKVKEYLSQ